MNFCLCDETRETGGLIPDWFNAANYATLNFFTVAAVVLIGLELGRLNKQEGFMPGIIALCSFVSCLPSVVQVTHNDVVIDVSGVIGKDCTASRGLFLGIVIALISVEIYTKLVNSGALKITMPDSVPSNVANSFNVLFPSMATVLICALFNFITTKAFGMSLYTIIYTFLQTPLEKVMQGLPGLLILMLVAQVFWSIGIHGNQIIKPVRDPLLNAAILANTDLVGQGITEISKLNIINVETVYPRTDSPDDVNAADKFDLFYNRIFLDPAIKGRYEDQLFDLLKTHGLLMEYTSSDLELMEANPVDWVGINLYHPNRVKGRMTAIRQGAPFHPCYYYEEFDLPGKKMNPFRGWEIYPRIIYDFALRMKNEYGNKEWFVAENGMGVQNEGKYRDETGMIQDDYRIDFFKQHLYWAVRGVEEGCNLKGYMNWAFTDNVSPMNAFKNRYGLVEIDLEHDRNRRLKKSAYFFQQTIANRCFSYDPDEDYK